MSIHVYWDQISIFPKCVIDEVNAICRCFLWKRTYNDSKPGVVAWDNICRSKKPGGLCFKDLACWNLAAISKLAGMLHRIKRIYGSNG